MTTECSSCSPMSSLSKKYAMGITGLLLCGFLFTHFLGNLTLIVGPNAFNLYSHKLVSNPLIYVAEAVLALIFLSHIFMAIKLTMENKNARPEQYYMRKTSGRGATFASSTMPYTGIITAIFLVIHILGLKFGPVYTTMIDGVEVRDIYRTTIEYFQDPLHVLIYIVAMISLGIHVGHGFWSAFQSIGFNHPKYMPKIRTFSKLYGLFVAIGFSIFPLFCYFLGGR